MISAAGLTKRFGHTTVLSDLDLQVERGERVAVLGLNGAGKTTLIRCLLGLTTFAGRLVIDGCDVRADGRRARSSVGYVPQRPPHFEGTLSEVVDFFSRLRGADPTHVGATLAELGLRLDDHGDKQMRELSGGMLQKALLALALGSRVPVLLLDEPTANLDARARREFLRALGHASAETTVLLATHRLADVDAVTDRLLVLHEGRIAFTGTMAQLWTRVGADVTLWIKVPVDRREDARRYLSENHHAATVLRNGAALGVRVERGVRADLLTALRHIDVPVEDFWTEAPSLHDLMERLLDLQIGATHRASGVG